MNSQILSISISAAPRLSFINQKKLQYCTPTTKRLQNKPAASLPVCTRIGFLSRPDSFCLGSEKIAPDSHNFHRPGLRNRQEGKRIRQHSTSRSHCLNNAHRGQSVIERFSCILPLWRSSPHPERLESGRQACIVGYYVIQVLSFYGVVKMSRRLGFFFRGKH